MKIGIEGLQIWCQTKWGSLYITTDSILCARPVFDWVRIFNYFFLIRIGTILFIILLSTTNGLTKLHK